MAKKGKFTIHCSSRLTAHALQKGNNIKSSEDNDLPRHWKTTKQIVNIHRSLYWAEIDSRGSQIPTDDLNSWALFFSYVFYWHQSDKRKKVNITWPAAAKWFVSKYLSNKIVPLQLISFPLHFRRVSSSMIFWWNIFLPYTLPFSFLGNKSRTPWKSSVKAAGQHIFSWSLRDTHSITAHGIFS